MYAEGQTATNPKTGVKIVFRGGQWRNASHDTGPGVGAPASIKMTEDQGKAQTYARLMTGAERSYGRAVDEGYNPGSLRNTIASVAEGLPLGGLDGVGAAIRDPVSDRARQAELQWSDAQLKAVSGAASPEEEVKRGVRTFFPRPGESQADIGPQKATSRRAAFEAAKVRSGPAGAAVGVYPQNLPPPVYATSERLRAQGRINDRAPIGSEKNPFVARDEATMDKLPPGSYVITPDGHLGIVE